MKLVVTGGGSGGHVYPAIALIKQLQEHDPAIEILYIGKPNSFESRICQEEGINFKAIDVKPLYRKKIHKNMSTLLTFLKARKLAKAYLTEFRPDCVIGMGGYVSAPVMACAHRLNIKTIIHEQNSIPGLTNKWLSRYANTIALSFEASKRYFKHHHCVVTGNPRSYEVAFTPKAEKKTLGLQPDKKLILIFFGSQGGKYVNLKMAEVLPLLDQIENCETVFVTGRNHYDMIQQQLKQHSFKQTKVMDYLTNMPDYLSVADVVISRAGATTIAELTAKGIPAIYIPSPYVTANHQHKNAQVLVDHQAGILLEEKQWNRDRFMRELTELINNDDKRMTMGRRAYELANIEGIHQLIDLIYH